MKNKKTYSKEDWFVPMNNRVFTDGVSEQITLVENERGDKISLNQESVVSQEFFNPFKKKESKPKYVREMNDDVFYYLDNTYSQRKPESLDREIKRLETISILERKGTLWTNQDIEDFKKSTKMNIPQDVMELLKKYSDITKPFKVYTKDIALDKNFIPEALRWVEDVDHNRYQKLLKDLDRISPYYPLVDIGDEDTYSWLVLTFKGLMVLTIHGDETDLYIENYLTDIEDNIKLKVTIANAIFISNIDNEWEKSYYAEQYKLGKWNPPNLSTESSDIDSYIDTPLLLKEDNSEDNDKEMTADDLTNDKEKAEEVKEEFEEKEDTDTTDDTNNETVDDNTGDDSTDSDNVSDNDNGDNDTTDTDDNNDSGDTSDENKDDSNEDKEETESQSLEGYKSIKDVFSNMNIF